MAIFVLKSANSLPIAVETVRRALINCSKAPKENSQWRCEIQSCELAELLVRVCGTERIFYESRDRDFAMAGFGTADSMRATSLSDAGLTGLVANAQTLQQDQIYFGAMRFDEHAAIGPEWQPFGASLFILPLVSVVKRDGKFSLLVNFRFDQMAWPLWLDRAVTLLCALASEHTHTWGTAQNSESCYLPSKEQYALNVQRALTALEENAAHKKVVVGRRNCVALKDAVDPAHLFVTLRNKSRDAFLFFLDSGAGSAFFGGSPELLYRRTGRQLETESLAGTRPRACDEVNDIRLRAELLKSLKDNQEHALVSLHIEERLKDFGVADLSTSKLKIMALAFVQHLLRRYRGTIGDEIDDGVILPALHPTPAVCGLDLDWARNFIRTYEGFDRGFYAGPIGYIANDHAEFAVAIRSALFNQQKLYVYAACGIVPGSLYNQEWEELNNKEKSILSIFDREMAP